MFKVAKYYLMPVGVEAVRVPDAELATAGVKADLAGFAEPRVVRIENKSILILLGFSGAQLVLVGIGDKGGGGLEDLLPEPNLAQA